MSITEVKRQITEAFPHIRVGIGAMRGEACVRVVSESCLSEQDREQIRSMAGSIAVEFVESSRVEKYESPMRFCQQL